MFEKQGDVAIPIGSVGHAIESAPDLAIIGKMWISLAELASYITTPNVRHEKVVDLPVKGGGMVKAHLFSVDGMLVEGMGAICIMGNHSAMKAEAMAQQGLQESIDDYRDYQDAAGTETSLTVINHGRETKHVF